MADPAHHTALGQVVTAFQQAGIYAYRIINEENVWSVACDLEDGHIDVRIGADGYDMDVWATSPGLFVEEEDERRRKALERLARISLPAIRRGFLEEHQTVEWSDTEAGIALRSRYTLPFSATERLPQVALERLQAVNEVLAWIERRITS